jgi:hypothetical protein
VDTVLKNILIGGTAVLLVLGFFAVAQLQSSHTVIESAEDSGGDLTHIETDKAADSEHLPPFVTKLIAESEAGDPSESILRIWRFTYRQNAVYFLPERCCHLASELYDETGSLICHPTGDFVGEGDGDGKCSDFAFVQEDGQLVWADKRLFPFDKVDE